MTDDDQPPTLALGERALAVDLGGHVGDLLVHGERAPRSAERPARRVAPPASRDAAPVDEAAEPEHRYVALY